MSSSSKALASVGAYDRFNYGDLLFPLVLDAAAAQNGEWQVEHYATHRADMRSHGAVVVGSARDLQARLATADSPRGLVLGGGEVLGARWSEALISLLSPPLDLVPRIAKRLLPDVVADSASRMLLRGARSWPAPYVPSENTGERLPVVANAIGASSLATLPPGRQELVARTLLAARYVSVRDHAGSAALTRHDIRSEIAPDSAAALARLHPLDDLARSQSLVTQCSSRWLRFNPGFADAIAEAAPAFEKVVLLPIGTAGGHGDHVALHAVERRLAERRIPAETVSLSGSEAEPAIWRIARTIRQAGVFVGTSLHGAITAMAYGTPHVGLTGIAKLNAYLETWGEGLCPFDVSVSDLGDAITAANATDPGSLAERGERLAVLSERNTARVLDAATGGKNE